MSNYKQTIVCVQPNQTVPDKFWDTILKEFPSCAGFAAAADGVIKMFAQSESPPIDELKGLLEDYKDSVSFLVFGSFPEGFSENSVQPFVTVIDNDDVHMVAFIDGNFDHLAPEDGAESGEFAAHEEYIKTAFDRIYKTVGTAEEFMQEVSTDPSIPKTIKLLYKGRATVTFLCSTGESISFGENALRCEYDWGWTSNPGTYKEAVAEEPKSSLLDKAKSGIRAGFGNRGPAAPKPAAATTAPAGPSALPAKVTTPPKSETAGKTHTVLHKSDAAEMVGPPTAFTTKNQIQAWYVEHNNGVVPNDWRNRPKIVDQKPGKETAIAAALVKAKEAVEEKPVRVEVLPVIPPAQLQFFKENFKEGIVQKTLSEGKVVLDPKRVAEMESEYPTFLQANGLENYNMFYGIEQEDLKTLIEKAPDLVRVMVTHLLLQDYKVGIALGVEPEKKPVEQKLQPGQRLNSTRTTGFGNRKVG